MPESEVPTAVVAPAPPSTAPTPKPAAKLPTTGQSEEAALAEAFRQRHPRAVEVAAGSEQRFAALAAAEAAAGSGRVPTRFLTFEDMVAYGMLPRFGSKVGFVQPLTVYAGTVLSRLIASRSVAVLGNSWRKERCSPATSCGRVYLTNLAELEPAKGDSGVKR